jgi:hypothetical protein
MAKGRRTEGALPAQAAHVLEMANVVMKFSIGEDAGIEARVIGQIAKFRAHRSEETLVEWVGSDYIYGILSTLLQTGERLGSMLSEEEPEEPEAEEGEKPKLAAVPKRTRAK